MNCKLKSVLYVIECRHGYVGYSLFWFQVQVRAVAKLSENGTGKHNRDFTVVVYNFVLDTAHKGTNMSD